MTLTECRDLRTGDVPWQETDWPSRPSDPFPAEPVDVAIVGSGIVGALIAQRLADSGRRIALFDRRPPGCGSTAASTAEIMWAMDVPMSHLATEIGEAEAARRWTRVLTAVRDLGKHIDALGLNGGRVARPTLYLTGSVLDEAGLVREADIHRRNGLPSVFLRAEEVAERFDIAARAAIASQGGFEIEPVRLCHALLDRARREGANLHWPVDVTGLHPDDSGIVLEMADGRSCRAENVILATGYERASLFLPPAFGLHSTFAIATPPGGAPLWRERAMIWEASDPYLYVRTDRIGRIIAGGEDIESADEAVRNALLGSKAGAIAAKLETLLGARPITIDRKWAATFGASPDGLPAIGPVATMPNVWMAAGFGGNGIAFASLAAQMLERELGGEPDPDRDCFSPYRFE
ncbi:glycine/D-amino acid oxidase-like deaminating enzyme [Novosphingobium fluoreni]|uniref:Glycine/D-amino acid oxidase-like deaminating enzyme n=1 Tax=Novosphingobium fluoreni TaxID=1391222 RepID=A0A7W6C665_9SPHN|nr:FAD-binding oxidoreductase [Novosphingobium fluoreni]MBB3939117.1 glycine/D-amino acid oxidase-like deaminating enzyme [Novosphingobium fluoreni]